MTITEYNMERSTQVVYLLVFALFNPALGMANKVVPPIDPSKPAKANPAKLLEHSQTIR